VSARPKRRRDPDPLVTQGTMVAEVPPVPATGVATSGERAEASRAFGRIGYAVVLMASDAVAIGVSFAVAYRLYASLEPRPSRVPPIEDFAMTLVFIIGSLLATFALTHLYLPRRSLSASDQLGAIFVSITIGNVVAMAIAAFTLRGLDLPRTILVSAWAVSVLVVWIARMGIDRLAGLARRYGIATERVLLVGTGDEAHAIAERIAASPELGYRVVGLVASSGLTPGPVSAGPVSDGRGEEADPSPPILGSLDELPALLADHGVGEVVIADSRVSNAEILDIVAACDRAHANVKVLPDVFHLVMREVGASEFGGLPMLQVRDVNLRGWNLLVKRAIDLVGATVLLVLFAPLMVAVAIAIKLTSPRGPVFFIQERVGVNGRPFPCVKFRSMRVDAEVASGPVWASPNDDRTTPLGRFLRRFSIDELPQLVNVLAGDMSLVGPRPERPFFVAQFSQLIPRYDKRHQEKAGVTGWAQVNGMRGQTPVSERTLYDLFYVEHWSPAFDLKILLKTVAAVLRGRNAY
jgi:exopolysaccharide biosynthesis polyprenyl glycosylphosphotransferase